MYFLITTSVITIYSLYGIGSDPLSDVQAANMAAQVLGWTFYLVK